MTYGDFRRRGPFAPTEADRARAEALEAAMMAARFGMLPRLPRHGGETLTPMPGVGDPFASISAIPLGRPAAARSSSLESALELLRSHRAAGAGQAPRAGAQFALFGDAASGQDGLRQMQATSAPQPAPKPSGGGGWGERLGDAAEQATGLIRSIPGALFKAEQTEQWSNQEIAKQVPGIGPRLHPGMTLDERMQAGAPPKDIGLRGAQEAEPPKWTPPVRGRDSYEGAQPQDFQGNDRWAWPAPGHYRLNERRLEDGQGDGRWGNVRTNSDGSARFHDGIDIAMPKGTIVYADRDGIVFRSDSRDAGGFGLQVQLGPDEANKSRFAHLDESFVRPGQRVKKGDPIGLSGDSGNAKPEGEMKKDPHLHYTVWINGKNVDPMELHRFGNASPGVVRED